jgi:chemotaxis protein MotB
MGKKCKEIECPKCLPGWLAAFGDLMSLLLCFFVLLLSMSTMDAEKINEAAGSLQGAMSVLDGETSTEVKKKQMDISTPVQEEEQTSRKVKTMKQTISETNELIKSANGNEITLEESEDGFMIRLPANVMFQKASDEFKSDDSILFLKRISLVIDKLPKDMHINVVGHTDDQSINTPQFRDNWHLSSARAIRVVKELVKAGIEPKRLSAAGKAEFDPIASNLTPTSRERNRRVEMVFFSKNKDGKEEAKKSILDR